MQMAHVSPAHPSLTLPPSRRQFQSCDQCRSRRRRCDAGALAIDPYSAPSSHGQQACTACAKVGRACTFTWLIQRKRRRTFIEAQFLEARNAKRLLVPKVRTSTTPAPGDGSVEPPTAAASEILYQIDPVGGHGPCNVAPLLEADSRRQQDQEINSMPTNSWAYTPSWDISPVDWSGLFPEAEGYITTSSLSGHDGLEPTHTSYLDRNNVEVASADVLQHIVPSRSMPSIAPCFTPASSLPGSLNLADERLATCTNNRSIVDILISTYRVNLEEVLSSWSTVSTCPYVSYSPELTASTLNLYTTFYDRANRMDASLPSLGLERVVSSVHAHRGMESQVLNKVILAFASQWNSASARGQSDGDDDFAQTLQTIMHRTLWHDAQRTLQKVAGPTGSFRIILARLIFAFTHNPLDMESPTADLPGTDSQYSLRLPGVMKPVREDVCASIVTDPDCLTQMEKALRDLLHWRRRLHAELWNVVDSGNTLSADQQSFLNDFNTLFWLFVMCDTTTSAISRRPLVISDNDCAIERIHPESHPMLMDERTYRDSRSEVLLSGESRKMRISLWNSVLLNHMDGAERLSLPFESIDAGAIIKEAIPLKVLLFRYIATLQGLIDQRAGESRIENRIQDALLVYRQWQAKYGDFMDGCVEYYATISRSLRSWHTILAAHWHYGVMLFAEQMQVVDDLQLGQQARIRERQSACTSTNLALSSATQVARLAQCCLETSRDVSSATDQAHGRFTMLSEPWCEIMVRSLATAAETLLKTYVYDTWYAIEQQVPARHEGFAACVEVLDELGACRYKTASRIAQSLREKLDGISQVG